MPDTPGAGVWTRAFLLCLVGGVVVSILIGVAFWKITDPATEWLGSISYTVIADNVNDRGFYSLDGELPTAWRPPAYPLMLAGIKRVFGSHWLIASLAIQSILGLACLVLVFVIARNLFDRPLVSVLAPALVATDGHFQFEVFAQRETILFTVALLGILAILSRRNAGAGSFVLVAVLTAGAYLVRPTGFLMVLVLPLLAWRMTRRGVLPRPARTVALAAAALILVVLPWHVFVYRNFKTVTFLPSSTSGLMLYKGATPDLDGVYPMADIDLLDPWIRAELEENDVRGDVAVNRYLRGKALAHISARPGRFAYSTLIKVGALYSPVRTPFGVGDLVEEDGDFTLENWRLISPLSLVFAPHALLILVGSLVFLWRRKPYGGAGGQTMWYFWVFALLVTALHAVTVGETRYRLFLNPIMCVLTARVLVAWWDARARRGTVE